MRQSCDLLSPHRHLATGRGLQIAVPVAIGSIGGGPSLAEHMSSEHRCACRYRLPDADTAACAPSEIVSEGDVAVLRIIAYPDTPPCVGKSYLALGVVLYGILSEIRDIRGADTDPIQDIPLTRTGLFLASRAYFSRPVHGGTIKTGSIRAAKDLADAPLFLQPSRDRYNKVNTSHLTRYHSIAAESVSWIAGGGRGPNPAPARNRGRHRRMPQGRSRRLAEDRGRGGQRPFLTCRRDGRGKAPDPAAALRPVQRGRCLTNRRGYQPRHMPPARSEAARLWPRGPRPRASVR